MLTSDHEPEPGALEMVRDQIAARGVTNAAVLHAMRCVPRSLFVPEESRPQAYEDRALPIAKKQTISQPFMVAHMTALLRLRPGSRVLEVGTGSGYQTAILGLLAGHVTTIERHAELSEQSAARLRRLGYKNIEFLTGDGSCGWQSGAPYDAILVAAAAPAVPRTLCEQLANGGRLVCPVGSRKAQELTVVARIDDQLMYETDTQCVFVPLIGGEGWEETPGV